MLPRNQQLAANIVGAKRVEIWGIRDEPLPCAEGSDEVAGVPDDWAITIVCHPPTATDAQLYALSGAYRIRITLPGTFRQVWLDEIQPIERPLTETGVRTAPSPPPPMPSHPAHPSAPCADTGDVVCSSILAGGACECTVGSTIAYHCATTCGCCSSPPSVCLHYAWRWIDPSVSHRVEHQPCGLTRTECCEHKQEHGAGAYQIDDAGCCDLIYFDAGVGLTDVTVVVDSDRTGAWLVASGTGA